MDRLTLPDNSFFFCQDRVWPSANTGEQCHNITVIFITAISLRLYFSSVWHVRPPEDINYILIRLGRVFSLPGLLVWATFSSSSPSFLMQPPHPPNFYWSSGRCLTHLKKICKNADRYRCCSSSCRTDSLFKHDLSSSSALKVAPLRILSDRQIGWHLQKRRVVEVPPTILRRQFPPLHYWNERDSGSREGGGGEPGVCALLVFVIWAFFFYFFYDQHRATKGCERLTHKREKECVCVCVCVCLPVAGCLLSLSCSSRGALSASGFTYWSNSEAEWLSWLERTGWGTKWLVTSFIAVVL